MEPQSQLPWQIEHFGEPVVCCQICNTVNFLTTQIPMFQKLKLKFDNSAFKCFIESFEEHCLSLAWPLS